MIQTFAPLALLAALCLGAPMAGAEENGHSGTKEEQQACTPDVFRLCSAAIPSERRIVACLKINKAKLSPACRKVIS